MRVRKFSKTDASFERSPGQDAGIFAGNVIDQRHGGPITIGYGRYEPNQHLVETLVVDDVMVVLEGRLSVDSYDGTITAGPGEIVHMPKGASVTIRSHEQGAVTAYVTYPHWQEARGQPISRMERKTTGVQDPVCGRRLTLDLHQQQISRLAIASDRSTTVSRVQCDD